MSDNLILTLLGAVGVGALVMGMNDTKEVKENFWGSFPFKANLQYSSARAGAAQAAMATGQPIGSSVQAAPNAINFANYSAVHNPARTASQGVVLERFSNNAEQSQRYTPSLGAAPVTGDSYPHVSYPSFQQSIPKPSPSLNLPAQIRYNPPSLDKMGITEAYQCNTKVQKPTNAMDYAGMVKENYMAPTPGNPNPGSNYAAGNYNSALKQAQQDFPPCNGKVADALPVGTMDMVSPSGDTENYMVFDQAMTTTLKTGRFRLRGVADLVRGDLPVCVDPCQKGWFQSPGSPADLAQGALQAIAGHNSASSDLGTLLLQSGYVGSTLAGGSFGDASQRQYNAMEMAVNAGAAGNPISVSAFA